MHGEGTEAALESACAHCGTPIEFSFVVTANGARSESAAAAAMVEWDPIPTADDRAEPHMLDGM